MTADFETSDRVRALRLSLAWALAIYGWFLRKACAAFISGLTLLVDSSWENTRGGSDYVQPLLWLLLAPLAGGLLLEMLPGRLVRSAGLTLLLVLPVQSVVSWVFTSIHNRSLAGPDSVVSGVATNFIGFVMISDPWQRAVWMILAVGVPLLLAAALAFWAVPRLLRR